MASPFRRTVKELPWTLTVKILLVLVVSVSGASITLTSSTYQSEIGATLNVANHLTLVDKGFALATSSVSATGTCPSAGNVTFAGSPSMANTAIASGDYVYSAQVNTTATTPTLSCFTVSLFLTPNGGPQQTYTVKIASGPTITANQTIDCEFDIGNALPTPPYTFLATVQ